MKRAASRHINQRDEVSLLRAELNHRHFDMRRVNLWPDTWKVKQESDEAKAMHDKAMKDTHEH